MCGKGTIRVKTVQFNIALGLEVKVGGSAYNWENHRPTGDIQPGDTLPIIWKLPYAYQTDIMRWGFPMQDGKLLANARADKMTTSWSRPLRDGLRIVVPLTGFYEHCKVNSRTYVFSLDKAMTRPLLLAGIYLVDKVTRPFRFTIVTTDANQQVTPVHHRMPAILDWEQAKRWMSYDTKQDELMSMLAPYEGQLVRRQLAVKVAA